MHGTFPLHLSITFYLTTARTIDLISLKNASTISAFSQATPLPFQTNKLISALSVITLVLFFAGCSTVDVKTDDTTKTTPITTQGDTTIPAEDPDALIAQGKFTEAAMLYLTISTRVDSPQKQDIQLKAINLLTQDKHFDIANNLLAEIDTHDLNTEQTTFYAYLNAKVAINERNPKKSQQWLANVKTENYSSFATEADVLRLFITTYELAGDIKSAALSRIAIEPLIQADDKILQNQQAIIRGLLSLNAPTLENIAQTESSLEVRAWVDLALLVKKSKNPFRLSNQLSLWQEQNPQHPIKQTLIASLAPRVDDEPPALENIALLLPITGAYSKPAKVIRDGFLASYYAQANANSKPTIHIYDTGAKSNNILSIYQQAIDNGASIIVGPLRKSAIKTIALQANHDIPTLVLNQLDDPNFYSENFYQFSLSPEDEAKQTAQRAWFDGHNRAAIIFPESKWGKRVSHAFKAEWENLGGEVVAESHYQSKKNDFAKPIKTLLAIDKSADRRRALSKLLRTRLKFEPRRRQDIDFIFMAAFPKQARLIPPQLKFYRATDLPIYATSHSFSGRLSRKKDRDIDNVVIGDMPWTLTRVKDDNYKRQIYRTWPNRSRKFNRLFAFGTDAYNVLYYLKWLRANTHSMLQGTTGQLQMNEENRLTRTLSWAKFKKGRPTLLPATATLQAP